MARYEMLNNIAHRDVRVITRRGPETGDAVQFVMAFTIEFRRAQAHYPIFFHKDSNTGQFIPVILLGCEPGENLFLDEHGWVPSYVPMSVLRGPFLIGYQADPAHPDGRQAVISIDMESPLVTDREDGEPLFLEHGGTGPYLRNLTALLEDIQLGLDLNKKFIKALTDYDLIESVTMNVTLKDGADRQLMGFYTINEDRLNALDGGALATLHEEKHLQNIYMILASQSHFTKLIEKRNAMLGEGENLGG
jgi:hypothetical protein